jgi:hypothetical protein
LQLFYLLETVFSITTIAFNCTLVNLIKPTTGWPLKAIPYFRSQLISTEFPDADVFITMK